MSEGHASAVAPAAPFKLTPELIILTTAIVLATVLQALDTTVANVALPHMQGAMSAAQDQVTWIITSYVVAAAIATPLTGYLAVRFDRRRLILTALITFVGASMLCGAAQSLEQIVIFRMMQGAAGACIIPLSQAIIMDVYPREKHIAALSAWSIGTVVAPILGPTIGGWLTEYYNWRWVFYVNLPVGALAILGVAVYLPESKRQINARFDLLGFALIGVAVGALQLLLDRGTTLDWFSSSEIVIEALLAAFAMYFFVVHIFNAPDPFFKVALFKDANYVFGNLIAFTFFISMFATMALMPTMLQTLMGFPVLETGKLLGPRGVGSLITMALATRLAKHMDERLLIVIGAMVTAVAFWRMSQFALRTPEFDIMMVCFIQGLGMGLCFTPLMSLCYSTLPQHLRTDGASTGSLIRNIGGSIGVSIAATMLAQYTQINHAGLAENVTPFNRALLYNLPQGGWSIQTVQSAAALDSEISRQAAMIAYIDVFRLMTLLMFVAAALVFFVRPAPKRPAAKEAFIPEA